jgi:hypothetical protein
MVSIPWGEKISDITGFQRLWAMNDELVRVSDSGVN